MSSGRLFQMLYLLLEHPRMTAKELAERFEVSVRTIYRDVDALSAAGVPIYTVPGKGGGVALMDHYMLNRAVFTEEEQWQLLTALQSLSGEARLGAEETLEKLAGLFRRREPEWLQVDLSRWGSAGADHAKFDALKGAILEQRVVSFVYVGSYGAAAPRRAVPLRLVFKGRAWYLQAYCLERRAYRTFKLTRVLELEVLEEQAPAVGAPPPVEFEGTPDIPVVSLCLRFSPAMAFRVYDEFDESCVVREPDGALTVRVAFPEDGWVYGFLLSFGAGVQVLEPEGLRRRLGRLAEEIFRQCAELDIGCQQLGGIMGTSLKQEEWNMEQQFCQSCGMPLDGENYGTERDGGTSPHYCKYCYQNGAFTGEMTMEEMIDFCAPMMAQANAGMTEEQAKAQMYRFFPMLLRWKKG